MGEDSLFELEHEDNPITEDHQSWNGNDLMEEVEQINSPDIFHENQSFLMNQEEISFTSEALKFNFKRVEMTLRSMYGRGSQCFSLPEVFIQSIMDIVPFCMDNNQEISHISIQNAIRHTLMSNNNNSHLHYVPSRLECLLILNGLHIHQSFNEQQKKIEELNIQVTQLEEDKIKMNERINSMKQAFSQEQERYLDLLQENELYKLNSIKTINELKVKLEATEKQLHNLEPSLPFNKQPTCSCEKKINKLKSTITDMRKREEEFQSNAEKKRMDDRKWYGEQILVLEADRDMYYNQCCSLQEEISAVNQDFEKCLKDKDIVIEEIKQKLDEAQASINEWNKRLSKEKAERKKLLNMLKTRDDHIQALQEEIERMDSDSESVWNKLGNTLAQLQNRADDAKNISMMERQILFNDSLMSPVSVRKKRSHHRLDDRELSLQIEDVSNRDDLIKDSIELMTTETESVIKQKLSPIACTNQNQSPVIHESLAREDLSHFLISIDEQKREEETEESLQVPKEQVMSSKIHLIEISKPLKNMESGYKEQFVPYLSGPALVDLPLKQQDHERALLQQRIYELNIEIDKLKSSDERHQAELKTRQQTYKSKVARLKQENFNLKSKLDSFAQERSKYERKLASLLDEKQEIQLKLYLANK